MGCGWRATCTTCGRPALIMPRVLLASSDCCDSGRGSPDGRSRPPATRRSSPAHMGHGDRGLALAEQALDEAGRGASSAQERRARQVLAQCLRDRGDVAEARRSPRASAPDRIRADHRRRRLLPRHPGRARPRRRRLGRGRGHCSARPHRQLRVPSMARTGGPLPPRRDHAGTRRPRTRSVVAQRSARPERDDRRLPRQPSMPTSNSSSSSARPAAPTRRRPPPRRRPAEAELPPRQLGDLMFLEAGAALALCGDSPGQAVGLAEAALALADEIPSAIDRCRVPTSARRCSVGDRRCSPAHSPRSSG